MIIRLVKIAVILCGWSIACDLATVATADDATKRTVPDDLLLRHCRNINTALYGQQHQFVRIDDPAFGVIQ